MGDGRRLGSIGHAPDGLMRFDFFWWFCLGHILLDQEDVPCDEFVVVFDSFFFVLVASRLGSCEERKEREKRGKIERKEREQKRENKRERKAWTRERRGIHISFSCRSRSPLLTSAQTCFPKLDVANARHNDYNTRLH